jgi:Trk K+ transport system NAD-binding subunit
MIYLVFALQKLMNSIDDLERYHNKELKHAIEHEFHANEHTEEDEEEIRILAIWLQTACKYVSERLSELRLRIKLAFAQVFFTNRRKF